MFLFVTTLLGKNVFIVDDWNDFTQMNIFVITIEVHSCL